MNRRVPSILSRALAPMLAVALTLPAYATPRVEPDIAPRAILAQADCYAVGQRVAAQNGGTLARATPRSSGGQTVCVIVVLMPAKDGQRPRRAEFTVPAG